MNLLALPAFADNYLWLLHDAHEAVVVDPGQAEPVLQALQRLRANGATADLPFAGTMPVRNQLR